MSNMSDKFKQKLEEATKKATVVVSNDSTVKMIIDKGENIKKRFIPYEDYVEKLFEEKKANAVFLLRPIPLLREDLGSAILHSIYEEIRESVAFAMFPSAIMHSILLLEYAMRIRLYKERQKSDPSANWENVAELKIRQLTMPLYKADIITKEEKSDLDDFNDKVRNPYMHINIFELTKGMTLDVTSVNIIKEEIKRSKELPVTENPQVWFGGKKKYDAINVLPIMKKCVGYVNKIAK